MQITKGELFYNNDEARHAINGIFFYDLISDLPLNPVAYAYKYYVQYPAVSIIHWPPFFYLTEVLFYALFGISAVSGRLAVLFFSLVAIYYWYRLVQKMHNKTIAFFSSILLATSVPYLFFSKLVMLEIPSLALSIAAIYYFFLYLTEGKKKDIYLFSISLSCAFLTKQNAIFLPLLFILYLSVEGKIKLIFKKEGLTAISICALLTLPYYIYAFSSAFSSFSKDLLKGTKTGSQSLFSFASYLYYPKILPEQVSWPILLLFGLSIIYIIRKKNIRPNCLSLLWIGTCYITFTAISQKEPRYIIYWVPPIILIAVIFIDSLTLKIKKISLSPIILWALCFSQTVTAFTIKKPYITGYEKAAEHALKQTDGNILFFDGYNDANFIFFVRAMDEKRKNVVLRGSKMLVSTNIYPEYGMQLHTKNSKEILELFDSFGINSIVVESKVIENIPIYKTLRTLLNDTTKFRLNNTIPIKSNISPYIGMDLLVYTYKNAKKITSEYIDLKMLTLNGKVLKLNLDKLNKE